MVQDTMNVLERDLQEVNASGVRMLSMVREGVGLARTALIDADVDAAERAMLGDAGVDALQHELEQRILTIIARRQPAGKDLRFLGAMFQSLADIERAGDYAAHVARAAAELAAAPPLKKYLDMKRILLVLDEMLERTMQAMADGDADAARAALAMDDEIDDLYEQIQRELLTYMMADANAINTATKLLAVARYLERCGDHIENVNEHVIFWLTGQRI
ncbi:phosphate signaling complex protein PhoU [soil metagenome]|nr:phosphate signaling complex protein PhoU [Trueperaceae bacterium]